VPKADIADIVESVMQVDRAHFPDLVLQHRQLTVPADRLRAIAVASIAGYNRQQIGYGKNLAAVLRARWALQHRLYSTRSPFCLADRASGSAPTGLAACLEDPNFTCLSLSASRSSPRRYSASPPSAGHWYMDVITQAAQRCTNDA
jgi:hypothetical protein